MSTRIAVSLDYSIVQQVANDIESQLSEGKEVPTSSKSGLELAHGTDTVTVESDIIVGQAVTITSAKGTITNDVIPITPVEVIVSSTIETIISSVAAASNGQDLHTGKIGDRDATPVKQDVESTPVEDKSASIGESGTGGVDATSEAESASSEDSSTASENGSRGTWDNQVDFLLSCLGYAVGLGNVWRFPYLCYENGGVYISRNAVLHEAPGIGQVGSIVWPLMGCLIFAWVIIYICLRRGIKSSGKVGIVWLDAAVQIFFSLSTSWGGLLTLSSYNRFRNNCCFDAMFIAIANCLTSVFAGFVIFSIIGFMAHELGKEVSEVVDQGFGLAFIAYPEALTRLPAAPVWSVLFFFMLLTLGLDTQFTIMETVVTFITDVFPDLRMKKPKVLLASCSFMFLASLICVTEAGVFWVNLLDSYSASFVILTFATMECIVICWVYGYDRFKGDIGIMIGARRVNSMFFNYWRVCWCFLTPVVLTLVQLYSFVNWVAPSYNGEFSGWAHIIGWAITCSTFILTPVFILVEIKNASGTFLERLRFISRPTAEWGPRKERHCILVPYLKNETSSEKCRKNNLNTRKRQLSKMLGKRNGQNVNEDGMKIQTETTMDKNPKEITKTAMSKNAN
ncbi:sodium- and chloride-dependent glycine transporter 2-like [Anneissia japonica]|uniref:sodium- and chloride-dependent glycine transporter 2-like n=1 Tax=Anneissia japonica TaxID=1529436 RepID=UPI0014255B86|nr:sodium- and chloride-dependent glycine transporter 2-like [Anneissia japonica]